MSEFHSPHHNHLLAEASSLIANESDQEMKARMMTAAVGEGMDLSVSEIKDVIDSISYEDKRSPDRVTPYQRKGYIAQSALEAFASQERFDDAYSMLEVLRAHDSHGYLKGITKLLESGFTGPNGELLELTIDQITDMFIFDPDYARYERGVVSGIEMQQLYLELYLGGVARTGMNIAEPGTEFDRMLQTISDTSRKISEDPWQHQRRAKGFASAYAKSGHLAEATRWKDVMSDSFLRASVCIDIIENTDDSTVCDVLVQETEQLAASILAEERPPNGRDPATDLRELSLRRLAVTAGQSKEEAERAMSLIGEPEYYLPHCQIKAYTEIYKHAGDERARAHCLRLTGFLGWNTSDIIEEIAAADYKWNNVLSAPALDNEPIPLIAWQVEKVFWGIDKYLQRGHGEGEANSTFPVEPKVSPIDDGQTELIQLFGMRIEPDDETTFGGLSAAFGSEYSIQRDLEKCQQQRDKAYVMLAKLLTKNGSHATARYLLDKIDGRDERVRCLVALGNSDR